MKEGKKSIKNILLDNNKHITTSFTQQRNYIKQSRSSFIENTYQKIDNLSF